MAAKVKFAKNYDHTWPSRAMTFFPAGWEGTVKNEVAKAAEEKGVLDGKPQDVGSANTATTGKATEKLGTADAAEIVNNK